MTPEISGFLINFG